MNWWQRLNSHLVLSFIFMCFICKTMEREREGEGVHIEGFYHLLRTNFVPVFTDVCPAISPVSTRLLRRAPLQFGPEAVRQMERAQATGITPHCHVMLHWWIHTLKWTKGKQMCEEMSTSVCWTSNRQHVVVSGNLLKIRCFCQLSICGVLLIPQYHLGRCFPPGPLHHYCIIIDMMCGKTWCFKMT